MNISGYPNDKAFLEGYDPTTFDRPSVAVDLVLLGVCGGRLCALAVRRDQPPQQGVWALPGGFVAMDESLDDAATRVLHTKVGLEYAHLEQLYTFGAVARDPRMRIISVAYLAVLREDQMQAALRKGLVTQAILAGEPLQALDPLHGEDPSPLAFDHLGILEQARSRLRGKVDDSTIAFAFLPDLFTLRALQDIHEAILGVTLNKPAFRRRMLDRGWLQATGLREPGASHRPAELYRLNART